jgi:hypothetical protein
MFLFLLARSTPAIFRLPFTPFWRSIDETINVQSNCFGIVLGASMTMARHPSPLEPKRLSTSTPADCREPYKSSRHKLLRFFEKSRDQWKAKCLGAKATVKRLQNRVRFLEKSKDRLQHRVSELEGELKSLKHVLQEKDHELAQLKKNCRPSASDPSRHRDVSSAPSGSHLFGGPRALVCVVDAPVSQ